MSILETMNQFKGAFAGIPILTYLIINFIDNINVTEIEIKLMAPKKKFLMLLTKNLLPSLIFAFISVFFTFNTLNEQFEKQFSNFMDFNTLLFAYLIIFLILILSIAYLTHYFFRFLAFVIGINYDFFIENTDGKWRVIRTNPQGKIIARKENEICFFDLNDNCKFVEVVVTGQKKKDLYGHTTFIKASCISIMSVALIILAGALFVFSKGYISFNIFIVLVVISEGLGITGLIIFTSKQEFDKLAEQAL
ncbi:hypothetical protein [Lysinibacillus piscis]|uniref:DUF443 family protein n=1 Tax=Lysinibacillus piscis TaxID=2518931 RepID=A0ABQ5NLZ5_9BACI|nr:hypothetical protein [Lysinibacillus sp. KH24]GLC89324.1 hypothetical protein LYSBPC_24510 [Lysinibacillus sp. KH24]